MQMALSMSKSHDEIEMFEGIVGTRAIRDSSVPKKLIEVPVAVPFDSNIDPTTIGYSPVRRVNLNMNLKEEQLNEVKFDRVLAEQLLVEDQSERALHPSSSIPNIIGRGLHAFDRKLPIKDRKNLAFKSKIKNWGPADRKAKPDANSQTQERQETPNPWYHHQKRKLLLRYQK